MSNLYKTFSTNRNLEVDGVWFEIDTETKFLLARAGGANTKYTRCLQTRGKPYSRRAARGTLEPEALQEIEKQVFLDSVLLDWKGVTDADGDSVEFCRGAAIKLFNDLPELYVTLVEAANTLAYYLTDQAVEMGEDLKATMDG